VVSIVFGSVSLYDLRMDQFIAAEKGDLQRLHETLTSQNVNDGDVDRWTALHCAASHGRQIFSRDGCQCKRTQQYRGDPVAPYIKERMRLDIARVLLDAAALVDATDDYGWTPLFRVVKFNDVGVARLLVDRGAKLSNFKVQLDTFKHGIPPWVTKFITSRSNCRFAAIIVIGIRNYHRTTVPGSNDVNVLKLISKHVWSMRMICGVQRPKIECLLQYYSFYFGQCKEKEMD
jgi:hypothetical protein